MCDYSLSHLKSRPAAVNERLVVANFRSTCTRGFTAVGDDSTVVVCLRPGTELVFDAPIVERHFFFTRFFFWKKIANSRVARFRQIDLDNAHTHHDALELADGSIIKLVRLALGQRATVLQLPRDAADNLDEDAIVLPVPAPSELITDA